MPAFLPLRERQKQAGRLSGAPAAAGAPPAPLPPSAGEAARWRWRSGQQIPALPGAGAKARGPLFFGAAGLRFRPARRGQQEEEEEAPPPGKVRAAGGGAGSQAERGK